MKQSSGSIPVLLATCLWLSGSGLALANPLQVRVERWLEIRQVNGTVFYSRGAIAQPATVGLRLQAVGDTIKTGPGSSSVLEVDTGGGVITIAANTVISIQQLQTTTEGGRLTRLEVTQGQARLQVAPLSGGLGSSFEIQTPAGSSAVRGTEFGVNVYPDGKTGIATVEGSVATESGGQSTLVNAGFQILLVPGEPPSRPVPFRNAATLKLKLVAVMDGQRVRMIGQVDPLSRVIVAGVMQVVSRTGQFETTVALPPDRRIEAVVENSFGKRQRYEVAVP